MPGWHILLEEGFSGGVVCVVVLNMIMDPVMRSEPYYLGAEKSRLLNNIYIIGIDRNKHKVF